MELKVKLRKIKTTQITSVRVVGTTQHERRVD